jgi:hypothetical protein
VPPEILDEEQEGKPSFESVMSDVDVAEPRPTEEPTVDEERLADADRIKVHTAGWVSFYQLRATWSPFLMGMLIASALFQAVLVVAVGLGRWEFKGQEVFLNTVAAQLFLQIAGMGYIVVRCLFPARPSQEAEDE